MSKNCTPCTEKFQTMIGGQALIEGIMMRGPEKDAIVCRGKDGLTVEVSDRKIYKPGTFPALPLIRGTVNFFDSQVTGVKALMRSADLAPEDFVEAKKPAEPEPEPVISSRYTRWAGLAEALSDKFISWLEKKLGDEKFQQLLIGFAVAMGLCMSIGLFFLLPMIISSFLTGVVESVLLLHLIEGVIRIAIFVAYIFIVSHMSEMKRVFAYHGAEHKTIRCYEAGLPLTVENVRIQTRLHPRCGTSFLMVVMVISILVFSVASSGLLALFPALEAMRNTFGYRLLMIAFKLLLLPVVVSITYEINRWAGKHDNAFTRIITAPGMWFQNFTTNEPDDSMIEVAIAAVNAVLPEEEGADRW